MYGLNNIEKVVLNWNLQRPPNRSNPFFYYMLKYLHQVENIIQTTGK